MIYGIDLGTTNSLIGQGNKLYSGLVPSIVDMDKRTAGESERFNYDNTVRGFKIDMSMGPMGAVPRVASSLVLKELKRVAGITSDIDAVISVPAYFNTAQRQATISAAEMAGIHVVSLINEPTAAAIYINKNENGIAVIFDLGGGTFDISVIESINGKHRVIATEGRILGGNDLDRSILEFLAAKSGKKWRVAGNNKYWDIATQAKIRMQKERKPIDVVFDDTVVQFTPAEYIKCMKQTFSLAVGLTKNVIEEADIEDYHFYFVGGSTRCPFLQEWVNKELGIDIPEFIGYDQDKVVAQGACMYAELLSKGEATESVKDVSKLIGFKLGDGLLEVLVPKNTNIPHTETTTHIASYSEPVKDIVLEFYQGDSLIADECQKIGELSYEFSEEKAPTMSIFDIVTKIDANGVVTITCSEILGKKKEVKLEAI